MSTAEFGFVAAIIVTAIALAAILLGQSISSALRKADASADTEVLSGRGAFIKPPFMQVGKWDPIEFLIGPNTAVISREAEGATLTPVREIPISKAMKVELLPDPSFKISAKSKARQDTGSDRFASWQWDVLPSSDGRHTLIAQVEVLGRGSDGWVKPVERYTRRVVVDVGVGAVQGTLDGIKSTEKISDALTQLLKSVKGLLIAAAAIVALIVGWRFRRSRRSRHGTDHAVK